ncbi:hypothetical protein AAY80_226 [Stenotrophomonas phage vB_SmaS-DLP_6]|nr:hypothetical protein AAY80_226 [Stenotrophomonas phage vB_SmaS-DLP_6]
MSDKTTFMSLPSLVRQALENTGGELGREVPADAYGVITMNNCDYLIIRDYIVEQKEKELKCGSL